MKLSDPAIYSKKVLLKRILMVTALVIIGVSFWYSSRLVRKLSAEERKKVSLWTEAIQRRARLVNTTANLFKDLEEEERQKIQLWSKATELIATSEMQGASDPFVLLALEIIRANHTIPVIIVDEQDQVMLYKNIFELDRIETDSNIAPDQKTRFKQQILDSVLAVMKADGKHIDINYIPNKFLYLYYHDSRTLTELRKTFQDIENNFISEVVSMAASTPVIYTNQSRDSVIAVNQVDPIVIKDPKALEAMLHSMESDNAPITIDLGNGEIQYVFYSDSDLLTQLRYYPFVQITAIALFVLIGYWLFSMFRRSEQDKVWVGMSKETAHQLGTPITSLMGWIHLLRDQGIDESIIKEMEKDMERLKQVTDRFSKIGAVPKLNDNNVAEVIERYGKYFRTRMPKNTSLEINYKPDGNYVVPLNVSLFEWVIENLLKNAIDAMVDGGVIKVDIEDDGNKVIIDVTDNGKGMPAHIKSNVFQPGFTSRTRGWGLGLSLSKRIIKDYHKGKIFVKWSEPGKGSTFRIVLNH